MDAVVPAIILRAEHFLADRLALGYPINHTPWARAFKAMDNSIAFLADRIVAGSIQSSLVDKLYFIRQGTNVHHSMKSRYNGFIFRQSFLTRRRVAGELFSQLLDLYDLSPHSGKFVNQLFLALVLVVHLFSPAVEAVAAWPGSISIGKKEPCFTDYSRAYPVLPERERRNSGVFRASAARKRAPFPGNADAPLCPSPFLMRISMPRIGHNEQ